VQRRAQHPTRILTPRHHGAGHLGQQVDQPVGSDRGEIRPERRATLPRKSVCGLQRQPGLADPARADQRHLTLLRETVQEQLEIAFPPDHPTRSPRQPGPRRRSRRRPTRRSPQRGQIVSQDPTLQLAQTRRRVKPQFRGQPPAVVPVGVEGLRDPAVRMKGAHEQRDPALPQRLDRDEIPRLGYRVRSRAAAQQQLDAVLEGSRPQFLQPNRSRLGEPAAELAVR
jgi:hypothetical protein